MAKKKQLKRSNYTDSTKIVFFDDETLHAGLDLVQRHFGITCIDGSESDSIQSAAGVFFAPFKIAYIKVPLEDVKSLQNADGNGVFKYVGRERRHHVSASTPGTLPIMTQTAAWGIRAIGADSSPFDGSGIKIAFMDTGRPVHPDFASRGIVSKNFLESEAQSDPEGIDAKGHGSQVIGIACGPKSPVNMSRYGVAYNASIYSAKVLDGSGNGDERVLVKGILWALAQGCDIINVSAESAYDPNETGPDAQNIGNTVLAHNSVLIAAAGNESFLPNTIVPVGFPANCPSTVAVTATTSDNEVWFKSNAGDTRGGLIIDVAAPGENILSCCPTSLSQTGYTKSSGTSMSTAFVSGVAALLCQASNLRGTALMQLLLKSCSYYPNKDFFFGYGLVEAPQQTTKLLTTAETTI